MGCFNDGYIPAAILLENPGLDIYEFANELNKVKLSEDFIKSNYACDSEIGTGMIGALNSVTYHQGVFGALYSLWILNRDKFYGEEFNGLERLETLPFHEGKGWMEPKYRKISFEREEFGKSKIFECPCLSDFSEGERISFSGETQKIFVKENNKKYFREIPERFRREQSYVVEDIIYSKEIDPRERGFAGGEKMIIKKLKAKEIFPNYNIEKFENLETLLKKYPEYSLENISKFQEESGVFGTCSNSAYIMKEGLPKWFRKNGRYYLDLEDIFKKNMESTHTSIILTAEAIKKDSWDVLSYHSGDTYPEAHARFLLENHSSFARYLTSLKDWWFLKNAEKRKLSNNQFLRERLTSDSKINLEGELEILREKYPKLKKTADWRKQYEFDMSKRAKENNKKIGDLEIPF